MAESIPTMMRSLAIRAYGNSRNLEILKLPVPELKAPDELLIKVHAASINPIDVKLVAGKLKMSLKVEFPYKIGFDVSGTVVAVGTEVPSHLKPGTMVYACLPGAGAVSEYAISTVIVTAVKPHSLSHIDAASIPLVRLTALQALDLAESYLESGLKDKTVYIPGALSGVGSMAVQLARHVFGVKEIITTLSTPKIVQAETVLGKDLLDRTIDYTKENSGQVIPKGSVDFMFDLMSQGLKSFHLIKRGGLIISISSIPFGPRLRVAAPDVPIFMLWILNVIGTLIEFWARRYGVHYIPFFGARRGTDLDRLSKFIDQGKLKPVVGRVSKFDDIEDIRVGCDEIFRGKGSVGKFVIVSEEEKVRAENRG